MEDGEAMKSDPAATLRQAPQAEQKTDAEHHWAQDAASSLATNGGHKGVRRIALDAGHGASRGHSFTGAHANGLIEDDLAFDFVTRIGHHLRLAGHDTVIIRPDAGLVALAARGRRAIDSHCDLFVSIHHNAGPSAGHGAEAYVAKGDERSRRLAAGLLDAICRHGLTNRGVKRDSESQYRRLRVLRDTYRFMPAVLLEIGFLTSIHDARLLGDRHVREAIASSIAEGISRRAMK